MFFFIFLQARSADLEKRCSTRGKLLIDSKNAGTTYGTRICCKGLTIKIYLNHHFAAFAVEKDKKKHAV
jgi:hypothetical protein